MKYQIAVKTPQGIKILYDGLEEVLQDFESSSLAQNPQGLFSTGFSACYAVVIRNKAHPQWIKLAHVSSSGGEAFYEEMIAAVGGVANVQVELYRAISSYEAQHQMDKAHDSSLLDTDTYFEIEDSEYIEFFKTKFGMTPVLYDMPHDTLVIDADGVVVLLEEYAEEDILISEAAFHEEEEGRNEKVAKPSF